MRRPLWMKNASGGFAEDAESTSWKHLMRIEFGAPVQDTYVLPVKTQHSLRIFRSIVRESTNRCELESFRVIYTLSTEYLIRTVFTRARYAYIVERRTNDTWHIGVQYLPYRLFLHRLQYPYIIQIWLWCAQKETSCRGLMERLSFFGGRGFHTSRLLVNASNSIELLTRTIPTGSSFG